MDLKELIKQYQALEDAAAKATDKAHAAGFTKQRDAVYAQIQALQGNPEVGDVVAPADLPPAPGALPAMAPNAPADVAAFVQAANKPAEQGNIPSNAAHGPSAQPTGPSTPATTNRGLLDIGNSLPAPNTVAMTPDQPPTSTTSVGAPNPPSSDLSIVELMKLGSMGKGGGGGFGVRAASANADQARADADAATAAQRQAVLDRGEHSYDAGIVEGNAVAETLKSFRAAEDEYQVRAEGFRQFARSKLQESEQLSREFQAEVARGTLASAMGETGNRMLAGLSVAMGAASAGLTQSGVNPGMEVLKFRIETDLKERQERLRGKAAAMDVVDRLLQRNQELFADETSARNATRAALFDQLKLETQRIAAVSGGQDALLNAKLVNASLDAELARSKEAVANQALLAATKAAGRGRKSPLELLNSALDTKRKELELEKLGVDIDAKRGEASGSKADPQNKRIIMEKTNASGVNAFEAVYDLYRKGGGKVPSVAARAAVKYGQGEPTDFPVVGTLDNIQRGIVNYAGAKIAPEEYSQAQVVAAMAQMGVRMLNKGAETDSDREAIRGAILMLQPTSPPEQVARGIEILNQQNIKIRHGIYALDRTAAEEYESERQRLDGMSVVNDAVRPPKGATRHGG